MSFTATGTTSSSLDEVGNSISITVLSFACRFVDLDVAHRGGSVASRLYATRSDGDGNWRLNIEYVRRLPCTDIVAAQVDDPEVIECAPHRLSHTYKAWPGEVARGRNKGNDSTAFLLLEQTPECPPPKIDIVVVEILDVNPSARFRGWVREVSQNGTLTLLFLWRAALDLVTKTHPTAFSVRRLIVFLDLLAAIAARGRSQFAEPRCSSGRIPDFPVTRSHPPASWPSAANSSICRTYRKTAGEESRRRSPVANRWMRP